MQEAFKKSTLSLLETKVFLLLQAAALKRRIKLEQISGEEPVTEKWLLCVFLGDSNWTLLDSK